MCLRSPFTYLGMRKHFQKWHPGQPVILMIQPDFYDAHTKDSKHTDTRQYGAKMTLDNDANVMQVYALSELKNYINLPMLYIYMPLTP